MKQVSSAFLFGFFIISLTGAGCHYKTSFDFSRSITSTVSLLDAKHEHTATSPRVFEVKTISEEKPFYRININYPAIGQKTIDAAIEEFVTKSARAFRETKPARGQSWTNEEELSYEIAGYSDKFISLGFFEYSFTGGAHPNSYVTTFLFDRQTGRKLFLKDIFKSKSKYLQAISEISIKKLSEDIPDGAKDWIRDGAGLKEENFKAFTLSSDRITIYFNVYQVAAYAAGMQVVEIPYEELSTILQPEILIELKKLQFEAHMDDPQN